MPTTNNTITGPTPTAAAPSSIAILLLCDDLMTTSRVREATRALGHTLHVAASRDAALAVLRAQSPPIAACLLSLTVRRGGTAETLGFLRAVRADETLAALPCAAFAGHVETEKHDQARAAGATLVVANSSIALHLDKILPRLLSAAAAVGNVESREVGDVDNSRVIEFGKTGEADEER